MSPWTALLQSLHSALIDELVERHPEPNPELGMPSRARGLALPQAPIAELLVCEIAFGESKGFGALALEPGFGKATGLDAQALWDAMLRRAGSEFHRRGIKPVLGRTEVVKGNPRFPERLPQPDRVIWTPLKVPQGTCHFGMGV